MKNRVFTIIIAICLVFLVLLTIFSPQRMISPGNLIAAHAELSEDCFGCHTPFIGTTPEKCFACHRIEEIGKKTTKGRLIAMENKNVIFHQQLIEKDCMSCHSDHKGVKSFRPISRFAHNLLDPTLQKQCNSCHISPGDSIHIKASGDCTGCHTQNAWTPATLDHEKYFRFDRHHETECVTCHINKNYASYTCYGCHEHSRSRIREEHVEEGITHYEICVDCHRSGDEDEAKKLFKSLRKKDSRKYRKREDSRKHRHKSDHKDDHDEKEDD